MKLSISVKRLVHPNVHAEALKKKQTDLTHIGKQNAKYVLKSLFCDISTFKPRFP